jgi:hypothetical protein
VPIARLAAAQAALRDKKLQTESDNGSAD